MRSQAPACIARVSTSHRNTCRDHFCPRGLRTRCVRYKGMRMGSATSAATAASARTAAASLLTREQLLQFSCQIGQIPLCLPRLVQARLIASRARNTHLACETTLAWRAKATLHVCLVLVALARLCMRHACCVDARQPELWTQASCTAISTMCTESGALMQCIVLTCAFLHKACTPQGMGCM